MPETASRPRTRADCVDGERPYPWVGCRHHLYLDVSPRTGSIKLNFDGEPEELTESCSLDLAARGGMTLQEVADLFGLTREAVRIIEVASVAKLRPVAETRGLDEDFAHFASAELDE